jgi:hypothetical protein
MARSKLTVAANILDACGRGFLIATAGVVAGLMFGTVHLAAMGLGLWTVGVAATGGIGCLVGSALVRQAAYDRGGAKAAAVPESPALGKSRDAIPPAVERARDDAPEQHRARRRVLASRRREHGMGRGA